MVDRSPLSTQELAWLTHDPPRDQQDQRIAWALSDRAIDEVHWTHAIEHVDLTLGNLEFTATQWQGVVFRRCVLRDVHFTRTTFAHAVFEDVVFERCRFQGSTLEACQLLRCRFDACEFEFLTALRSGMRACVFDHLSTTVLDLRECDLSGTRFVECNLQGLRASKLAADTLELRGGQLTGGDLTLARVRSLQFVGVALDGLRILDSHFEHAAVSGARINDLSLGGTQAGVLAIFDCPELLGLRVLESTIGELRLETCPMVAGPLIAQTKLDSLVLRDAILYDAAFERVDAGPGSRILGGAITGVLFVGGTWAGLDVSGAALNDYVAVRQTHFERLRFSAMQVSDPLDLRLDGDSYGDGSMTWSDARGA